MTEEEQQKEQYAYEQYIIETESSLYEIEKHGVNDYKIAKDKKLSNDKLSKNQK
jgi:hypothetical protein